MIQEAVYETIGKSGYVVGAKSAGPHKLIVKTSETQSRYLSDADAPVEVPVFACPCCGRRDTVEDLDSDAVCDDRVVHFGNNGDSTSIPT